ALLLPALAPAEDAPKKKAYFGIMIGTGEEKGTVVVLGVISDSPAEKGGLKVGDVLVKVNDTKPADLNAVVKVIGALEPGKKVKVVDLRDGKEKTLEVVPVSTGD